MARSNKNRPDAAERPITHAILPPVYNTAIYARLSVEDNGCEHQNIQNQIELLKKYIAGNRELALTSIYYDNGATGTNFERAGFAAMLNEVKRGNINCIVVKDLSRFGRNYVEAGNYLENIFPYLNVRFISVNDCYDSICVTSNEALALSLKNICAHMYAKDISLKICTALAIKKKQGLFLGRFAPYGYKKSESNRHKLEIEEETAPIVRDIFHMRLEGTGAAAIARILNDRGVASQHKLLYEKGLIKGTNFEARSLWSGASIKGVLQNPIYYGCMVERKGDYAYYKGGQKQEIRRSEWRYIENTHDAIIDKAVFMKVQQLMGEARQALLARKEKGKPRARKENMLRGLLICGHCKRKMHRSGGYYRADEKLPKHRFFCGDKYRKAKGCKSLGIDEHTLLSALHYALKTQLDVLFDADDMASRRIKSAERKETAHSFFSEQAKLKSRLMQIQCKRQGLYSDYKQGLLSKNAYVFAESKYEEEQGETERKLQLLCKSAVETTMCHDMNEEYKTFSSWDDEALSREICMALFDNIEVYNGLITMQYAFACPYEVSISPLRTHADSAEKP